MLHLKHLMFVMDTRSVTLVAEVVVLAHHTLPSHTNDYLAVLGGDISALL